MHTVCFEYLITGEEIIFYYIIIKMSLFGDTEIAEYSSHISSMLQNYELYNRVTFHNWYFGATRRSVRSSPESGDLQKQYRDDMNRLVENGDPCYATDIGGGYSEDEIRTAFSRTHTHDILFAVDKRLVNEPDSTEKTSNNKKLLAIAGVIIVEKGVCDMRKNSWGVNVICVKPNTIKGSILMGACLYCIKANSHINPECILELADGYSNLPAFYSYTALGFLRDDSLWGEQCLHTKYCMPMRADLDRVFIDDISKRVLGTAPQLKLSMKKDPSGLWNRKCYVSKRKNYARSNRSPGYAILNEIQTISNLILGLTLLKEKYRPGTDVEKALYASYRRPEVDENPDIGIILSQLSAKLNEKLREFDKLNGVPRSFTSKRSSCAISGGKSRRRKSLSKKSRRLD